MHRDQIERWITLSETLPNSIQSVRAEAETKTKTRRKILQEISIDRRIGSNYDSHTDYPLLSIGRFARFLCVIESTTARSQRGGESR